MERVTKLQVFYTKHDDFQTYTTKTTNALCRTKEQQARNIVYLENIQRKHYNFACCIKTFTTSCKKLKCPGPVFTQLFSRCLFYGNHRKAKNP